VGTGVWWFVGRDSAGAATADSTTTNVAASLTTMEKSVTSSGTLTPTVQESVSFAVGGTVTAVAVGAGDTVTEGQVLATVDTLQLDADLLSARADLATAQADLADLEADDDGSDAAQAQIDAAAARIAVAQAAVTAAEEAMAGATLVAPAAGLVTSLDLEVGQRVAGSGGGGGTTSDGAQVTIVGTGAYEVSLSVGDSDVALVAVGNQVELTSDDLDGTVFGVVRSIGLLSTATGVAAYPVVVDVTGDTSALHDGIAVDASIIYERRTDVLTVPSAAITTNDDGTTTVTKVEADGTTSTVAVTTAETSGSVTEIVEGLAEGDEVQVVTYARSAGEDTQQGQLPGGGQFPGGVFPGGEVPGGGQMPEQMRERFDG
jgi:macrolide-specific efflux system membrane fusion protein